MFQAPKNDSNQDSARGAPKRAGRSNLSSFARDFEFASISRQGFSSAGKTETLDIGAFAMVAESKDEPPTPKLSSTQEDRPARGCGANLNKSTPVQEARQVQIPTAGNKVVEAYSEVIQKLFLGKRNSPEQHVLYGHELARAAEALQIGPQELAEKALCELRSNGEHMRLDQFGRAANSGKVGRHFEAICGLIAGHVDLYIVHDEAQLKQGVLPLSASYREQFKAILDTAEVAVLIIAKTPPESAAIEIRKITDQRLHGLMGFWAEPDFQRSAEMSPALRDYLSHATVRVLCTGKQERANQLALALNQHLERAGGFEDSHWVRMVKGISQGEKQESLKDAFRVCIPVVALVKALEHFAPGALHVVGGVLDDLFGAIIPDASQSMGRKDLPYPERVKHAWPVLKSGLLSLPIAGALGWLSSAAYDAAHSGWAQHAAGTIGLSSPAIPLHVAAGLLFAFACCAGTLGTSIAAYRKARRAIKSLETDKEYGRFVKHLTPLQKTWLAFKESILDIPFRVGHTVIGVPFQIGLGVAAGLGGFFHNGNFVTIEGVAETVLGAAAVFIYPYIARRKQYCSLRRLSFSHKVGLST